MSALESQLVLTLDLTNSYPTIAELRDYLIRADKLELDEGTIVVCTEDSLTITEGVAE